MKCKCLLITRSKNTVGSIYLGTILALRTERIIFYMELMEGAKESEGEGSILEITIIFCADTFSGYPGYPVE